MLEVVFPTTGADTHCFDEARSALGSLGRLPLRELHQQVYLSTLKAAILYSLTRAGDRPPHELHLDMGIACQLALNLADEGTAFYANAFGQLERIPQANAPAPSSA